MSRRRNRRTWGPTRQAANPPATPGYLEYFQEDPHPASQMDPDKDKYQNGDTSSWAEDPHPGPYLQGPHPATPWEGTDHPAAKPDHLTGITESEYTMKEARELQASVEKKAANCIRIAQQLLGKYASETAIEDQALLFMDLPPAHVASTLRAIQAAEFLAKDEEASDEGKEAEEDEDKKSSKKAQDLFASELEALRREMRAIRLAMDQNDPDAYDYDLSDIPDEMMSMDELMSMHMGEDDDFMSMDDPMAMDEEAMLQAMLDEEKCATCDGDHMSEDHMAMDEESMLRAMLEEEAMDEPMAMGDELSMDELMSNYLARKHAKKAEDDEDEAEEEVEEESEEEEEETSDKEASFEIEMFDSDLGLSSDDAVFSELYNSKYAAEEEEAEEEEAEEEVEEEDKEAKKKASVLRPKKRKPSSGVQSLGNVSKTASNGLDLQKLWPTAPDISDVFKS